jgi:hypothetical protein
MFHMDDDGFATAITVLTGSKYWVVFGPKRGNMRDAEGDLASTNAFPHKWGVAHPELKAFDAEGIFLTAGDVL